MNRKDVMKICRSVMSNLDESIKPTIEELFEEFAAHRIYR